MSNLGFRLAYLNLNLVYSRGHFCSLNGVSPNILDLLCPIRTNPITGAPITSITVTNYKVTHSLSSGPSMKFMSAVQWSFPCRVVTPWNNLDAKWNSFRSLNIFLKLLDQCELGLSNFFVSKLILSQRIPVSLFEMFKFVYLYILHFVRIITVHARLCKRLMPLYV